MKTFKEYNFGVLKYYPAMLSDKEDDGEWVTGDPTKPIEGWEDEDVETVFDKSEKQIEKDRNTRDISESASTTKGWINPKTKKSYITERMRPYHVEFIIRKPRDYGLNKKQILDYLETKFDAMDAPDPAKEAKQAYEDMLSGRMDIERGVELLAMKKGWYRVVGGTFGSIAGIKKLNDKEISVILNIMEDEGVIGFGGSGTREVGLEVYEPYDQPDVQPRVKYYGQVDRSEVANLLKGRPRGAKQTEIGRTMAMFREFIESKRVPKTRKNQDPDTHSDLYTDEDPRGTIHGLGFKDVETAEASVRKIESSDRSHAHKIQAAIAMEQRAKVMKKNAEAAVYRRYIEKMKKKTEKMNEAFNLRSLAKNNAIVKAVQRTKKKTNADLMLALLSVPAFASLIKPDNLTRANIIGSQLKMMILGEDRSK